MKLKSACSGAWIALLAAAVDRVGKSLMLRHEPGEIVRVIPGIVQFRRTANTGMAFSLFSENGAALTILTAVLIAAVVAWLSIRIGYFISGILLLIRCSWKTYAKVCIYTLHKARAVSTTGKACSTPYIWVSNKLCCIGYNRRAGT